MYIKIDSAFDLFVQSRMQQNYTCVRHVIDLHLFSQSVVECRLRILRKFIMQPLSSLSIRRMIYDDCC